MVSLRVAFVGHQDGLIAVVSRPESTTLLCRPCQKSAEYAAKGSATSWPAGHSTAFVEFSEHLNTSSGPVNSSEC